MVMSDGVWNVTYSPYDMAFSDDILLRVGPALDAVINDLDWIIGKLENEEINSEQTDKGVSNADARALLAKIDSASNIAEQKLLKGEELDQLMIELNHFDTSKVENEILKRKIEKLQKAPNTVWSDRAGYAISGLEMLSPWKEVFLELSNGSAEKTQKYFRPGSREEIYEYLRTLIPGAQSIKIYDNYVGEELLQLLEHTQKDSEIFIIGDDFKPAFRKKLNGFLSYFERNLRVKKIKKAHLRFYIIDGNVYNVDASLAGKGADHATMISPVVPVEADKMIKDFDDWWDQAEEMNP